MRIAVDISSIVYGTGVSVYTKNLIKNLIRIDYENKYLFFGGSLRRRGELESFLLTLRGASFKGRVFPIPPTLADILWNKLHIFSIDNLIGKVDVFHSSDWTQPPIQAFKVTTIHDLVPFKYPELSHSKIVSSHKARMKWVIKEVDRVIVPTQTTSRDVEELGIEKKRIRIIPEGYDPIYKPAKKYDIEKIKRKYKISGKYILTVGVGFRKNTNRIIEAYKKIRKEENFKLVAVGQVYSEFINTPGVVFAGHVTLQDMPSLYSGAEVFVYPSLYEGFGLPILESFSCRTPVVTSNLGSMAEVAGGATVLVDPTDVNSIIEGIEKALNKKDSFVKKGIERLRDFSWESTAKKTLEVYNSIQENPPPKATQLLAGR